MYGFEYSGKSTQTIIDTPLILVSIEGIDSAIGIQRNKLEGEITISRPITNEYGTTHEPLSFTYGLMKSDYEPFTKEEQIAVERWLTSPKFSSELKFTDCNDETFCYFGLFINTEWVTGNGGFMVCNFTFQVNGRHCFKYVEHDLSDLDWQADPMINYIVIDQPDEEKRRIVFTLDCQSDELEEYVYPVIEATAINKDANSTFTFLNETDPSLNHEVTVRSDRITTIVLDCKHCMITQYIEDLHGEMALSPLKYSQVGWADVGNIYWPRLLPGKNLITIIGDVNVKISYYIPYKKVGGWLI